MKKIVSFLALILLTSAANVFAQNTFPSTNKRSVWRRQRQAGLHYYFIASGDFSGRFLVRFFL